MKRIFKVTVEWDNRDWDPALVAEYIADWVKTGEGSFGPNDRPEIQRVKVKAAGGVEAESANG